jgi:hypothetical protein
MKMERVKKGIPLMNCEMVCLPKQVGGMGVANIKFQNHALLTKWNVKLYTDTACL